MHFFAQFRKETRMDLIRHMALTHSGDAAALRNLEHGLQLRTYDFHEELDYFYLLKGAAGPLR
jgi:hypothetical protein